MAIKPNNIYQGDCLELMKGIPDNSVDMILADLPYGTTRNKWDCIMNLKKLWELYNQIIKDNGVICLFGSGLFSLDLIQANRKYWRYNLIWEKTQPTGFLNSKKMPLRTHEDIIIFYKQLPTYNPQKTYNNMLKQSKAESKKTTTSNYNNYKFTTYSSTERYPTSILKFKKDTQTSRLHPTQKPVALLEYLIKTYTNKNDIVLDNVMGSGSTIVACMNTDRQYIGMELNEEYFEIAKNRIENINK